MSTEATKDYLRQWASPGVVMGLVAWLVIGVGAWYRLSSLEGKFADLSTDVRAATKSNQEAEKESIRLQADLKNALVRIESLERFRDAQQDYNASTMTSLAVLGVSPPDKKGD